MARIRSEQATTITFNEADADALVWSASPRFHRHMEKLGIEPYRIDRGRPGAEETEQSHWYRIPKERICIKLRREVSKAERARLRAQGFQPKRGHEAQRHEPRDTSLRQPTAGNRKTFPTKNFDQVS
jgi:hypothetical protein